MLLEYALRLLIQNQQMQSLLKSNFDEQLQHFRHSVNLSELGNIDEIFTDVRDKTQGRSIEI